MQAQEQVFGNDVAVADDVVDVVEVDVNALFSEIRQGLNVHKNKTILVSKFTPLVHKVARKCTVHIDHDDLVQNGFLGLMNAIEQFDPSLGVSFITYAYTSISRVMYRESNTQRNLVFIPVNKIDDTIKLQRYLAAQAAKHGPEYRLKPTEYPAVANELGMTISTFEQCMMQNTLGNHTGIGGGAYSLDHLSGSEDANDGFIMEVVEHTPAPRAEKIYTQDSTIKAVLEKMHPIEAELLVLWYGLRGEEQHSLDQMLALGMEDRNGKVITSRSTLQRRCIDALENFKKIVKSFGIDPDDLV